MGLFATCIDGGLSWNEQALTINPSLLGFTLAAYAIFISNLDPKLKRGLIKAKDTNVSYFKRVNVSFFHFIFCQCIVLVYALLEPEITGFSLPLIIKDKLNTDLYIFNYMDNTGYFLISLSGTTLLIYSTLQIIAVLIWVHRIVNITEQAEIKAMEKENRSGS